jgi:hypothetical protein
VNIEVKHIALVVAANNFRNVKMGLLQVHIATAPHFFTGRNLWG